MKSKNDLKITGILVADVMVSPERRYGRFTLAHNFGGGIPTLYLSCLIPGPVIDNVLSFGLKKGDTVTVRAYLRPYRDGVEAVIKKIEVKVSD